MNIKFACHFGKGRDTLSAILVYTLRKNIVLSHKKKEKKKQLSFFDMSLHKEQQTTK